MATTELALPKIIEVLSPEGGYDLQRRHLQHQLEPVVNAAKAITAITTHEESEKATSLGRLLQAGLKEQESFFKGIKQQVDEIKKPILQAEKDDAQAATREKARLGELQTRFDMEQARLTRERQRLADEEAKRQAEEDALQRAIEMEEAGDDHAAEQILAEPIVAAPVVIQRQAEKPKGAVTTTTYWAEVVSFIDLVKAVAEGKAPLHLLSVEQGKLNREAASYKEAFSIPGCKLKSETKTNYRS